MPQGYRRELALAAGVPLRRPGHPERTSRLVRFPGVNWAHAVVCSSGWWERSVERDVLEIGPGFGATTRVLARRPGSLTVIELAQSYCERLRRELDGDVEIVQA